MNLNRLLHHLLLSIKDDYKGGQPIVNPEGNEIEGEPGNEEMDEFDDDDEHF